MDKTTTNTNPALAGQKNKPLWWHSLESSVLNTGAIIDGVVIERTPKALYVDLGKHGTGIVWGVEFSAAIGEIDKLKAGDPVRAKISNLENALGLVDLSLKDISREASWQWAKTAMNKSESITGKVLSANRGGLIITANNMQGFLPTSQMTEEHFPKVEDGNKDKILESLEKLVGSEIKVRVLDFNGRDGKVIFSEKKLEEKVSNAVLEKYKIDDVVGVIITKLAEFGAYADFTQDPEAKGFISLADIDWKLIEKPEDIIKTGEKHQAKIVAFKDGEIKLSLKALKKDPWLEKAENYKEGGIVSGEVYKFMPFGALIKLDAEIYGFIHSSEFGGLEKMRESLELKKTYEFSIESVKMKEKRINLKFHPVK